MASNSMNKYDKQNLRNIAAVQRYIDRVYQAAVREAARIGLSVGEIKADRLFSFDDYPNTRKRVDSLLSGLKSNIEAVVLNGIEASWTLANNKNNELSRRVFGDKVGRLTEEQSRRYFSTNDAARRAFEQRRVAGLNLSDRVWRYTEQFKSEIEMGLDIGIRSGRSAEDLSRDLRGYLREPDRLFRRVRDEHGQLVLSRRAEAYHPGQGVYRSSYKNARRLAATETNIAYRTSDTLRWQQMDFVVGIEIKLSNNHTLNGVEFHDICDTLAGKYPKDFKFTGWHPHCRCHAVSILKTDEEIAEDTRRILAGEPLDGNSVNRVDDVPEAFRDWIGKNAEKISRANGVPHFIKDNPARVATILSEVETTAVAQQATRVVAQATIADIAKEYKITRGSENYADSTAARFDLLQFKSEVADIMSQHGLTMNTPQIEIYNNKKWFLTMDDVDDKFFLKREFRPKNTSHLPLLDGEIECHHSFFELAESLQGKGISKQVFRALYTEYQKMGVRYITVDANINVGGYTWAKYGFYARNRREALSVTVRGRDKESAECISLIFNYYKENGLSEDSPFPMHLIASQPWGKRILLGSFWEGVIDLKNKEQVELWERYLGLR